MYVIFQEIMNVSVTTDLIVNVKLYPILGLLKIVLSIMRINKPMP